jgi:hypothetical protein
MLHQLEHRLLHQIHGIIGISRGDLGHPKRAPFDTGQKSIQRPSPIQSVSPFNRPDRFSRDRPIPRCGRRLHLAAPIAMAAAHRLTKSLANCPTSHRHDPSVADFNPSTGKNARLMGRLTEKDYRRMSVGHLVIIQSKMMADLMNHRVAHFLHDFFGASAQAQDGPAVNRDSGRQLAAGIEKRIVVSGYTGIETKEIVCGLEAKIIEDRLRRLVFDNDRDILQQTAIFNRQSINGLSDQTLELFGFQHEGV